VTPHPSAPAVPRRTGVFLEGIGPMEYERNPNLERFDAPLSITIGLFLIDILSVSLTSAHVMDIVGQYQSKIVDM
jgi:hypothetical protein